MKKNYVSADRDMFDNVVSQKIIVIQCIKFETTINFTPVALVYRYLKLLYCRLLNSK